MRVWLSAFLLILLIVSAAYTPALCGEPENVKVAVTMPVLGSIVKEIGGDLIEVESLLPPNIDPHSYEPNIEKVLKAVSDASLIVMSGPSHLPIEEKIEKLHDEGLIKTPVINYRDYESMGLTILKIPETGAVNPHGYFYSISGLKTIAKACAAELSRIDPSHAEVYEKRLESYLQDLSSLGEKIRSMKVYGMKVILGTPMLQYMARDLDLKVVDVIIRAHGLEPSAEDVSKAVELIKSGEASIVLISDLAAMENPALLKSLRENQVPYVMIPVAELVDEPELISLAAASLLKSNLEKELVEQSSTGDLLSSLAAPSFVANLILLTLVILLLVKVRRYGG